MGLQFWLKASFYCVRANKVRNGRKEGRRKTGFRKEGRIQARAVRVRASAWRTGRKTVQAQQAGQFSVGRRRNVRYRDARGGGAVQYCWRRCGCRRRWRCCDSAGFVKYEVLRSCVLVFSRACVRASVERNAVSCVVVVAGTGVCAAVGGCRKRLKEVRVAVLVVVVVVEPQDREEGPGEIQSKGRQAHSDSDAWH